MDRRSSPLLTLPGQLTQVLRLGVPKQLSRAPGLPEIILVPRLHTSRRSRHYYLRALRK